VAAPDFLAIGARSGLIPGTPLYGEAISVAVEHCLWCHAKGLTPLQVILPLYFRGFGPHEKPGGRIQSDAGWDNAVWHVAAAYRALPLPFEKPVKVMRGDHEQDQVAASVSVDGGGFRRVLDGGAPLAARAAQRG